MKKGIEDWSYQFPWLKARLDFCLCNDNCLLFFLCYVMTVGVERIDTIGNEAVLLVKLKGPNQDDEQR